MILKIDPTVDIVFKTLLGSDEHKNLLIHFLNAIMGYTGNRVIVEVTIRNPYNGKTRLSGKQTIVDIKAIDQLGREHHIEIQVGTHKGLFPRMLSYWSQIYLAQVGKGGSYTEHKPVISIWLLRAAPLILPDAIPGSDQPVQYKETHAKHLDFGIYSKKAGLYLSDHLGIHVLQLKQFGKNDKIKSDKDRWLHLFANGGIDPRNPPPELRRGVFKEVMNVLQVFTEQEENHHAYLSRLHLRRRELTELKAREEAEQMLEAERLAKEQALAEREQALAEKERERLAKEHALTEKERERLAKEHAMTEKERERLAKEHALAEIEREREKRLALELLLKSKGIEIP